MTKLFFIIFLSIFRKRNYTFTKKKKKKTNIPLYGLLSLSIYFVFCKILLTKNPATKAMTQANINTESVMLCLAKSMHAASFSEHAIVWLILILQ